MRGYDEWKATDPNDRMPENERQEGCTCSGALGAGGMVKRDKWCPVHGLDPDDERHRRMDER